jgi:hypothetical protein
MFLGTKQQKQNTPPILGGNENERKCKMSDPKEEVKATNELQDRELENVSGGNQVDPVTLMPNYHGPKVGQAFKLGSQAEQEINPDSTSNDLPGSGGGVIV